MEVAGSTHDGDIVKTFLQTVFTRISTKFNDRRHIATFGVLREIYQILHFFLISREQLCKRAHWGTGVCVAAI